MRLALILDPLEHIKTYKDTSFAIMREAAHRGHELYVLQQGDVLLQSGTVLGQVRRLEMQAQDTAWYVLGETERMPLHAFDAVLMRKDPPFDMEYVFSTYLLELAETQGARIFNKPA